VRIEQRDAVGDGADAQWILISLGRDSIFEHQAVLLAIGFAEAGDAKSAPRIGSEAIALSRSPRFARSASTISFNSSCQTPRSVDLYYGYTIAEADTCALVITVSSSLEFSYSIWTAPYTFTDCTWVPDRLALLHWSITRPARPRKRGR
jgi:hypothetical protein